MTLTATLGAAPATLGNVQPGFLPPAPASNIIEWVGPFDPGEYMGGGVYFQNVHRGAQFTVTHATVLALALSDPGWWQVVS